MSAGWPFSAWFFWGASAATGLLALALLAWALWRDKSHKTRHCPKCGYEMTGVPGLTCPECGRTARSEKALFRRRRSQRSLAICSALLLLAGGLGSWPSIERDGWWTFAPDTALIWFWPQWVPERTPRPPPGAGTPPGVIVFPASPPTFSVDAGRSEIIRRLSSDNLWDWQKRWLGDRCLSVLEDGSDPVAVNEAQLLLSQHLTCSQSMRGRVLYLLAQDAANNTHRGLGAQLIRRGSWRPVLVQLLEELSARSSDGEELLAHAGRGSHRQILAPVLAAMADRPLAQSDLDSLTSCARSNPLILPDALVEHLARLVDGEWILSELVTDLRPSRTCTLTARERRICRLLRRVGQYGPIFARNLPGTLDPRDTWHLQPRDRQGLTAAFYMARSLPWLKDSLADSLDEQSWVGLWARVIAAEAAGDSAAVIAELHAAMMSETDASSRIEAIRMVGTLCIVDPTITRALEAIARADRPFLSRTAVFSLTDIAPDSPEARAALDRLKTTHAQQIRDWLAEGDDRRPPFPGW
jgi:hypothetical protein